MRTLASIALFAALAGCTQKNPAAVCHDGTCIDPSFPFCDVDGTVGGGMPGTCIAVTCAPNEFGFCRDDTTELRCNAEGTNYDVVQCPLGCDPGAMGCRVCQPNQTVCANGMVQTCDANGSVVSTQSCPLGCFENQPRCRDIDPSNGLGQYLDMVSDPPDIVIPAGSTATIDTTTGVISISASILVPPSFALAAPPGGVDVRVIIAHKVTISGNLRVQADPAGQISGPALAILATSDIVIDGHVAASGSPGTNPGGSTDLACAGGKGQETDNGSSGLSSGTGGGGFATPGAAGGAVISGANITGGSGGGICGNAALVPLHGGGPSGGYDTDNGQFSRLGGPGGGAIQLSSRTSIDIEGVINLDGGTDYGQVGLNGTGVYGGGAGGGLLLEAPSVVLGTSAALLCRGYGGESTGTQSYVEDGNPIPGFMCAVGSGASCGPGGAGAAPGIAAVAGSNATQTGATTITGGGGGGGLGRIRINTPDATYMKRNTTIEAASVTTGSLATR